MILARIEIYVYYFFRKLYSRPYARANEQIVPVVGMLITFWLIVSLQIYENLFGNGLLSYIESFGFPLVITAFPLGIIYIALYFLFKRKLPYSKKKRLIKNFPNWFEKMGNELPFLVILFSFGMFLYTLFFLQSPE